MSIQGALQAQINDLAVRLDGVQAKVADLEYALARLREVVEDRETRLRAEDAAANKPEEPPVKRGPGRPRKAVEPQPDVDF